MCGLKEEEEHAGECSQTMQNATQEQIFLQQMQQQNCDVFGGGGRSSGMIFPEVSPILPWTTSFPAPVHNFNPLHFPTNPDPFPLPPPPSQTYGGFFNRRQQGINPFGYEDGSSGSDHHHLRMISNSMGQVVQPGLGPFSLQAEMMSKMSAQEIMDAKALAASKSHSEAERRRRERINNHLAKLRSLLPNTTKTDKASLLAEVIQHVKELRHQTSLIAETCPIPTETDELTVDNATDENGTFLIKASLCCEDRSDLMPELIKTLKQLRLKTLKAEITTLGGRVKNVLFITWDEDHQNANEEQQYSISSIQQALKSVMERTNSTDDSPSGSVKRQRTNINIL